MSSSSVYYNIVIKQLIIQLKQTNNITTNQKVYNQDYKDIRYSIES